MRPAAFAGGPPAGQGLIVKASERWSGVAPVPRLAELQTAVMHQARGAERWGAGLAALMLLIGLGCGSTAAAAPAAQDGAAQAASAPAVSAEFERQVLQVLNDHPEAVFEALQRQLKRLEQRKRQARQEALTQLERNPAAVIGSSPTLGQGSRRLIVFSDFQCPYCAEAARNLSAFLARNGSRLSLTYKFYPLVRIHPEALNAARAAWAAQKQGRFWPFHDALFAAQDRLGEPLYVQTARSLGLDLNRFNRDRASQESLAAIARDQELGDRLGLEGTPFFVVRGEAFSAAVDEAFLQKLVEGR